MEQNGISIVSPPGITENSIGKSKSIGITLRSNSIQSAKEKLKSPWLKNMMEDITMMDIFVLFLAEIIGTGILVFIGCMSCIGTLGETPSIIQISFAFGLAVMIAIQCVGHISGAHINPAITVGSVILGYKSLPLGGFYIVAQCLGSFIGYGLIKVITPYNFMRADNVTEADSFCMTDVHPDLTLAHGVIAEILATGILVFFAGGVWDLRNKHITDSVAIKFGLCVAALCIIFIPYTGCSINPARTFGPAVWNSYWRNHWVFWIGPIGGSIIASLIYRFAFSPKPNPTDALHVGTRSGIET